MKDIILALVVVEAVALIVFADMSSDWVSVVTLAVLIIGIVFGWAAHAAFVDKDSDKDDSQGE